MNIKNLLIGIAVITGIILAQGASAVSGTLTLTPATRSVAVGQSFTVAVTAAPSAGSVYTIKSQINFPATLLEVTGFSFAPTWLSLTQSGYDSTDNGAGVLVKSAGYPGGVATATTLGTITFRAKAAGSGAVTVGNQTLMLDASNNNVYTTATTQTAVTVTGAVSPAPTVSRAPTPRVTATVSRAPTPTPTGTPSLTPVAAISPTASPSTQTATILGFSPRVWAAIAAGLVALLAGWLLTRPTKVG